MRIKGNVLRDQIYDGKWPRGTRFKCVGHWDNNLYYFVNNVYELSIRDGVKTLVRVYGETKENMGGFHSSGNGFSGIWELVKPPEKSSLEDWL